MFSTGVGSGHEAAPVVVNGVMFLSTPEHRVVAIDAKTGVLLWRFVKQVPDPLIAPHPTTRGIALYGDRVFFAANDAVLVALDARTGSQVWAAKVAENKAGYYMTLAPLMADGKVMVGASGGELGVRGFVAAYDPETGKRTVAHLHRAGTGRTGQRDVAQGRPVEERRRTRVGDRQLRSRPPTWRSGAPATAGRGWAISGPATTSTPRPPSRSTSATGQIKGHFQYHPNDSWDWDEVSPPILVDFQRNGRTVKGLIDVARNGYLWFLERTDGPIKFVEGKPFVRQNAFRSLDPVTGRPDVDPARKPGTGKMADFCPSHWGGKNWPPIAYSPKTRMIYIPANENLCATLIGRPATYKAGSSFTGATSTLYVAEGADHIGEVQALERRYRRAGMDPPVRHVGELGADAGHRRRAGVQRRHQRSHVPTRSTPPPARCCGSSRPTRASPGSRPSFTIDGKQYVAVASGWGVDARAMQARLNRLQPGKFPEVPEGGAIWVFALP